MNVPIIYDHIPLTQRAQIIVTFDDIINRRGHYTYDWEGRLDGIALIDRASWRPSPDDVLRDAPWPLVIVGLYPMMDAYGVMRRDVHGGWPIIAYRLRAAVVPAMTWLRSRIILTLMVWGLAYVGEAEVADWRCIGRRSPYDTARRDLERRQARIRRPAWYARIADFIARRHGGGPSAPGGDGMSPG